VTLHSDNGSPMKGATLLPDSGSLALLLVGLVAIYRRKTCGLRIMGRRGPHATAICRRTCTHERIHGCGGKGPWREVLGRPPEARPTWPTSPAHDTAGRFKAVRDSGLRSPLLQKRMGGPNGLGLNFLH
jgi:hypothetical protein